MRIYWLVFCSRWSFLDYSLLGDILLQLYDEHSYQKKKKRIMEEVIIKPVGSQHIFFCSPKYCCYACEGFVLLFCLWWGSAEMPEGDLCLLDTTTLALLRFSAIELSFLFQEGSIAEFELRCDFRRFLYPTIVLYGQFWPCHGFFINRRQLWCTWCYPY